MKSQSRWILAGVAIGLAFLWLALREADFAATWEILRGVHLGWAGAVLMLGLLFMAIKSWRWSIILEPLDDWDYKDLHRSVYIGTAANLVIAHSGELIRATLVAREKRAASSAVLATIAIERIFDFVALVALTAVALILDARLSPVLWSAGAISLAIIAIALCGVTAFLTPHPLLRRWGQAALLALPERLGHWVAHQLRRGVHGLGSLRNPMAILKVTGLSLLQWSCIVAAVSACSMAVDTAVPISGAIAVFVLTVIGLTLPSSPAQLGTTQLAFVVAYDMIGKGAAQALAASLVYTCFVVVAMMVVGAICWALLLLRRRSDRSVPAVDGRAAENADA